MQIKGKFIAPDSIDGSKVKLKIDEALRGTKQDGTEIELLKLDSEDKALIKGSEVAFKSQIDAEEAARIAKDAETLASANSYTDTQVAALVNSAPEVLDTLKELSDALGGDENFAVTVAGQIAAVQAEVDAVEVDVAAHEARLDVMDIIDNTEHSILLENNAGVYADAFPGIQDPAHREGWYFKNEASGQKVNWYFFDGTAEEVSLGDFSGYAIVTFDSLVSKPHLAVYTLPTGSGDIGGWYKSRVVYIANETPVAGKKYLMYFGQDPKVHPELPRLTMSSDNISTRGTQDASERVMTAALGSDSATSAGNCEFVAEAIGVFSPSVKRKLSLKIRKLSQASFDALASKQEKFTVDAAMISAGSVTLANKTLIPGSVVGFMGRLGLFAGEDFTVSTDANGYPVVTFAGEILPGQDLALEAGDVLRFQYLVK